MKRIRNSWYTALGDELSKESGKGLEIGAGDYSFSPPQANVIRTNIIPKRAGDFGEDVENLSYQSSIFDFCFCAFVFCCLNNPSLGVSEMVRVTKPGGRILFLEHTTYQSTPASIAQRIADIVHIPLFGCRLANPIVPLVMGNSHLKEISRKRLASYPLEPVTLMTCNVIK